MPMEVLEVQLPTDIHQSIWEAARILNCSPGEIITQAIRGNPPPVFTGLPEVFQSEATRLNLMDDISLSWIAQEQMPKVQHERLHMLKSSEPNTLSQKDKMEIEFLRSLADTTVARRCIAMAILKWRGSFV